MAMRPRIWERQASPPDGVSALGDALGVNPVVARLLWQRGLTEPEAAARFLAPQLDHLHDPSRLTDMPRAVERILAAIARRERVIIHGDYDVDGVSSTVMLHRLLAMLGGDVGYFVPDRMKDGYGLQPQIVERLRAEGALLIVSVDCGIRAVEAAETARRVGVDLIVTDHHEPDGRLPPALAVINPKRHDCAYPDKHLSGAGVALKLAQAICQRTGREKWLPSFLKIAALGTLADVVPLVGENRVIARLGLDGLSKGPHAPGLQALLEAAGLAGRTIDSYHVAFLLAPRVNAAGRMASPDIATRLLLASDAHELGMARELAERLNEENVRRQQEEASMLADARRQVESNPDIGAHNLLVLAGEGWHRGVIGIVASKLVETFGKPSVVVSIEGDVAHGSCRSISAFDVLAALERCADVFDRFGGHRQAAGFTLAATRLGELRRRLTADADERISPDDLRPRLRVDAGLRFDAITPDLVDGIERLAPFGMWNPRPVFDAEAVEVLSGPARLKERHLSMTVRQGGRVFRALAWRAAERSAEIEASRGSLDVAFSLERNTFRGETAVELNLADLRPHVTADAPAPEGRLAAVKP